MHGYVDPFAHRLRRSLPADDRLGAPTDGAAPEGEDDDAREDLQTIPGASALTLSDDHDRHVVVGHQMIDEVLLDALDDAVG